MADCDEMLQDECIEILVKTETESVPRGEQLDPELSSFEMLINTALGLEKTPLCEHDYAYSNKSCVQNDHSYSSASLSDKSNKKKLEAENPKPAEMEITTDGKFCKDHSYFSHKQFLQWKDRSVSHEDLSHLDIVKDHAHLLLQYRSNDSALDMTGFDTISDKCLSHESIHLQTVDVFTEQRIFSGISDPDISRMSIQTASDNMSASLPNSPRLNAFDHTYSNKTTGNRSSEGDVASLVVDHTYNTCDKQRRDSLPTTVGIKRGRSNDDLNLTKAMNFKRVDFNFKKSPFLDQSYRSLEKQKPCKRHGSLKHRKREKPTRDFGFDNIFQMSKQKGVKSYATYSESNKVLSDHTYEEISDTATCFKVSDLVKKVHGEMCDNEATKCDTGDHSYVMPTEDSDDINERLNNVSGLSDSGTESLNESDEEEMSSTFERLLTCSMASQKDHAYVK